MSARWIPVLALLAALVLGCSRPGAPPELKAVWADGEESTYDIRSGDTVVGTEKWTLSRAGDRHVQSYEQTRGGHLEKGQVVLDASLRPVSASRESEAQRIEVDYAAGSATVRTTPAGGGAVKETVIATSGEVVDNEALLMVQRGLVLPEGGSTSYLAVVPRSGSASRVVVTDEGRETREVPAGRFEVRCLGLIAGISKQKACYSIDAPHFLVEYENPKARVSFALRSYRAGRDTELKGSTTPAPVLTGPAPIGWLQVLLVALVDVPIMLLLPLLLAWQLKKRFGVGWLFWAAGAGAFVASQVVHLPLNWALGLIGQPRALGLWPLPALALAAGFSAGLCEEVARFVVFRFALRKASRTWHEALQYGVGHGGVEAMILGLLVLVQVGAMLVMSFTSPATLGVPAAQVALAEAQRDAFWLAPWYGPVVAAAERLSAMSVHLGCSVLVVRAVARKQPRWLAAAILFHTLVDALAVWLAATRGVMWTELAIGVLAVAALAMVWALREPLRRAAPAT